MTKEVMTIHKALSELKVIDSRITSAINNATLVKSIKNTAKKIDGMTVADYKANMSSNYDKITDLIKRRNAIKRAVVLSNAVTKVTVGGVEYTVAEAIDMKNHGMDMNRMLLNRMSLNNRTALAELDKYSGENMEKKAEQYALNFLGVQGKDAKTNSSEIEALRKTFIENNEYVLLDPLKIKDKIEELNNEIIEFMTDVDAVLSVSNALTTIDVEY